MHDQHHTPNQPKIKIPPPPVSTSFLTTLLGVLHYLQGMECYHKGVPCGAIECYMCKHYPIDGDIKSQITCAINQALRFGFIQQRKDYRYTLVHAVAGIYFAKRDEEKQQELCYARHLFETVWRRCPASPPECPESCVAPAKRRRRKPPCRPILSSGGSITTSESGSSGSRSRHRQKKKKKVKKKRKKDCKRRTKKCRPRRNKRSTSSCEVKRKSIRGRKCSYERIRRKSGGCSCKLPRSLRRY